MQSNSIPQTPQSAADSKGKYIYCVIQIKGENEPKNLGSIGIGLQAVEVLPYRDIAAVVSDTPVINFDRLDKKELTKHVAFHQKVNEAVMKLYDVVPMTFGIIAPSKDEALRILEKAYLQFKTGLKKIEGKVEFAVQVRWDNEGLVSERSAYIKDIQDVLGNITYDPTLNKLLAQEMLANFSFLIQKTREPELDRKMQGLGKRYEGKLKFKYIGPMPPYSFSNINLGLGNFELIDEARKLLGLAEEAAFDEIKKAYHNLAHKYHPDKYGGESKTAEQMKKISQAYSILESYCQGGGKKENQKYSFKEEDVKNSIIVK